VPFGYGIPSIELPTNIKDFLLFKMAIYRLTEVFHATYFNFWK